MSLNSRYLQLLAKNPLLTKSVTALILLLLNEQILTLISKTPQSRKVISKMGLMLIYGGLISTPISHYCYILLNKVVKPTTARKKLGQLALQLMTILPLLAVCMISYIQLINDPVGVSPERMIRAVKANLLKILKSSWGLNMLNLLIAQNFLRQELWVVFFTFNFFVLGTYQNTTLKLRMRKDNAQIA